MAHRSMILAAAYLLADLACALSVNGALLLGANGHLWAYASTIQVF